MAKCILLGLVLLAAGCESATVPTRDSNEVYDFHLPIDGDSLVLHWPSTSRIRVFLNPSLSDQQNTVLRQAFQLAATAWETAALYVDYRFAEVSSVEQADVLITWSGSVLPVETAECPAAGGDAFTTFCLNNERNALVPFPIIGNPTPGSVRMLVTIRTAAVGDTLRVRSLIAHELGHVLGLVLHSLNMDDLMYSNPVARAEPSRRDRATVQLLYQTRADILP